MKRAINHIRHRTKAVILDFSGTTLDAYVLAPAVVFQQVFAEHGVNVTMKDCREPMGLRKDLHINKMLQIPEVGHAWYSVHGTMPTAEVEGAKLFKDFVPMQLACLPDYAELLPGVQETVENLRRRDIKIGLTTGFTRVMVDVLERHANEQGLYFDATVAGDDVQNGARPTPHMLYKNLDKMGINNINEVIKVDDTVSGIGEGINANCRTVAVSRYSNYMQISSMDHEKSLSKEEIEERHRECRNILRGSGADHVVDDITTLPLLIDGLHLIVRACLFRIDFMCDSCKWRNTNGI